MGMWGGEAEAGCELITLYTRGRVIHGVQVCNS